MKKIEANIKPFKLDEVKEALDQIGIDHLTVSEIKSFGRRETHMEVYRGNEFHVDYIPEIKIELVLQDSRMDAAVAAILKGAGPNKSDRNKVFISNIENVGETLSAN